MELDYSFPFFRSASVQLTNHTHTRADNGVGQGSFLTIHVLIPE